MNLIEKLVPYLLTEFYLLVSGAKRKDFKKLLKTGFIIDRFLSDLVPLICDLMHTADEKYKTGLLMLIDLLPLIYDLMHTAEKR